MPHGVRNERKHGFEVDKERDVGVTEKKGPGEGSLVTVKPPFCLPVSSV